MKKMMMIAMMMVITISAQAMPYTQARDEALFLSDKMAYELGLTEAQYEAVYEINLDYLLSLNGSTDIRGIWWNRRDTDLRYVLTSWQYERYITLSYFYTPVSWRYNTWVMNVYTRYADRTIFYKARPKVYVSYRGGNNHRDSHFYAGRNITKPTSRPSNWIVKGNPGNNRHNNDINWRRSNNNGNYNPTGNGNTDRTNRTFGNGNRTNNNGYNTNSNSNRPGNNNGNRPNTNTGSGHFGHR